MKNGERNWLPYAGLAITIAGIIYQAGTLTNRVQANTERVVALEAANASMKDAINDMNLRGARMETKLDLLVEPRMRERRENR